MRVPVVFSNVLASGPAQPTRCLRGTPLAIVAGGVCGLVAWGCASEGGDVGGRANPPATLFATVSTTGGMEIRYESVGDAYISAREALDGETTTTALTVAAEGDDYVLSISWPVDEFEIPTEDVFEGDDALSFVIGGTRYTADTATVQFTVDGGEVSGTFEAQVPMLGAVTGTFEAPLRVVCYRRSTAADDGAVDGSDDGGWTQDLSNSSPFCQSVMQKVP